MKVVKRKSDGKIVYRSEPEFEEGFGIKNAISLYGGLPDDYEEVEITETEWNAHLSQIPNPREKIKKAKDIEEKLDIIIEYLGLK